MVANKTINHVQLAASVYVLSIGMYKLFCFWAGSSAKVCSNFKDSPVALHEIVNFHLKLGQANLKGPCRHDHNRPVA